MNEFELLQLIKKIEQKFENKISELEKEIATLKQGNNVVVETPVKENSQLLNYYLNRYSTEAESIKNLRLEGIIKEIEDINIDYDNIKAQLFNLEQRSLEYDQNLEIEEDLKNQLSQTYASIEEYNFDNERKCRDLYKEVEYLDEIYSDKINRYINIVGGFMDGDYTINETNEKLATLISYFYEEGYRRASVEVDLILSIDKYTSIHNKQLKDAEKLIQSLNQRLNNLNLQNPDILILETKGMLEDVELEIERKNQVYNSLLNLINNLTNKHLKQIKDTMEYLELIDSDKQAISEKLEALLSELLENLKSSDTDENRKNNLILHLQEIDDRINELEELVVRKNVLENEYNDLEKILKEVTNNQRLMQNHVDRSYQIIRSNPQFRYYFDNYISSNTKIKELESNIQKLKQENLELREVRKTLVLDMYAKQKLQDLDAKIALNDRDISFALKEITFIRDDLKEKGSENEKLYKVIKDKEIAESSLPIIDEKKNILIEDLTRKYEELKQLETYVEEYNNLVKEAESINEKLQNNNY